MIGQRPQAKTWIAGMLLVLALAGCGLLPDVKDETAGWSAEKLYSNAHDAMPGKNPATAAIGHAFAGGGKLSAAVPAINHCRPGGFAVRRVHGCKISCSRAAAPGRNRHGVGGIFCIGQRSGGLVGPAKGSQQQQSAVCDLGVFEPSCQRQHYRVGLVRRLTIAVDPHYAGPPRQLFASLLPKLPPLLRRRSLDVGAIGKSLDQNLP